MDLQLADKTVLVTGAGPRLGRAIGLPITPSGLWELMQPEIMPEPGHANTLSDSTDISGEVKRRFLPGLKAGVSTPRS